MIGADKRDAVLKLFGRAYPNWIGFSDPRLAKSEIEYKREASRKLGEILGPEALTALIEAGNYDEILKRINKAASSTNLLYTATPSTGDTSIVAAGNLDKPNFSAAFRDLLWGEGDATTRLDRYLDFVRANDLPNKWAFPTYFLFLSHPDTEVFAKPQVTKWLCGLMGEPEAYDAKPTGRTYEAIRGIFGGLRDALAEYGATDMIGIQSIVWVAHDVEARDDRRSSAILPERRQEFAALLEEFREEYVGSAGAETNFARYRPDREKGRENFNAIDASLAAGQDITEGVLLGLLPYDAAAVKASPKAWRHVAPVFAVDVRRKFEGSGWVRKQAWPRVARAIFDLVQAADAHPADIGSLCAAFSESKESKGFQTGTLSPILNALRPDDFLIINNKPRAVINYLTGTKLHQNMSDYPELNRLGRAIVGELGPALVLEDRPEILPCDAFDQLCHWLVAIKKWPPSPLQYWKISPGENGRLWDKWREDGYIAIGWDELGDLTDLSKAEYVERRDKAILDHPDWKAAGMDKQVWRFASQITEGDRIAANRGTTEVVGIGTVAGPYFYAEGKEYSHRYPVAWDDLEPRPVKMPGWKSALQKLTEKQFGEINAPSPVEASAFSERAFELLAELASDPRVEVYERLRDECTRSVEAPMRDLMQRIAGQLPAGVCSRLETKKDILSRFRKNDFGRGRVHAHLWSAFYPKGGQRIADGQLFVRIKADVFSFGFYVGDVGTEQRSRFLRNVQKYRTIIAGASSGELDSLGLEFGTRLEPEEPKSRDRRWSSLSDWLDHVDADTIRAARVLSKSDCLERPAAALAAEIARIFEALYPLWLCTVLEDPGPALDSLWKGTREPIGGYEPAPPYSLRECASETGFEIARLERWVRAIERKRQAIIYGPPGTGKTFIAERLAKHLIGEGDGFVDLVQFHPAYAYEDFMQGIRPETGANGQLTYPMQPGRFLDFCREARRRKGRCVLIIDEINRAPLSRVFGELMYLLEYRGKEIPLAGGQRFSIPENVRLIGTMNTADRSIALVDHALRRRFAFLPLYPDYAILRQFHAETGFGCAGLIGVLEELNRQIGDRHYEVGITYFMSRNIAAQIEDVWRMEIEPYLDEYFFDQPEKAASFSWDRVSKRIAGNADGSSA